MAGGFYVAFFNSEHFPLPWWEGVRGRGIIHD
jgi:hypothetical protein